MEFFRKLFGELYKKPQKAVVRETTYIGKLDDMNNIYIIQQTADGKIVNYCISAQKDELYKMLELLSHLFTKEEVFLYLRDRLLLEPFVEKSLERAMQICRDKLPEANIDDFSPFMM